MHNQIICGDAFNLIKTLPEDSIDCIITSPPFYKMRSVGIDGELGQEKTSQEYIDRLVEFFELAKKPLKSTGNLFLNLGDKYIDKQLEGVPWRTALALKESGWRLISDIIWDKMEKCMPSSYKRRVTVSHEYIFHLALTENYYWDYEALREKGTVPAGSKGAKGSKERYEAKGVNSRPPKYWIYDGKRGKRSVWHVKPQPNKSNHYSTFPVSLIEPCVIGGCPPQGLVLDPYMGAATTAIACIKHNRNYCGFELNPKDVKKAEKRISKYKNNLPLPS